MPKKKRASWFTILKRLFVSEPRSRLGLDKVTQDKRKRWAFRLVRMKELTVAEPTSPVEAGPQQLHTSCSHDAYRAVAAIKIQAMFRGYLARKALRALKGVVKLQALIRGWAVRQQAINTLKCLQSIVNIQSKTTAKDRLLHCQEYKLHDLWEKDIRVDLNSQKTREESHPSKREGLIKRERMKEYYLNHRRSAETERDRAFGRRRYWLEQWVDAQLAKSEAQRTLSANDNSSSSSSRQPSSRQYYNQAAETPDSPMHVPRIRSCQHRKQRSIGDESSFTMPAYMAATESAKARVRSLSSPRLRPLSFDVCSEITSPYKHKLKLSPISSINSELTSSSWIGNISHVHVQKSPRLKNLAGPVKSTTSIRGNRANEASPKRKT